MKKYIYERADWPEMKFDESLLREPLIQLHRTQGKLFGKLDALGFDVQDELRLNAVSDEVVSSSVIEGEKLNRSSVRSSVARKLGIETAGIPDVPASHYTESVVDMALDATQNYSIPVTDERLFGWHSALFPTGRSGIRSITTGAYRVEGIAVVSGVIGKEKTHYEAPAPERVPDEMNMLLEWIEAGQGMDPYIKTAIAHLWFELIHPFDDGNGRIGRAVADLLLARAENSPKRYYSLSSQLMLERKAYYDELEAASEYTGDVGRWVAWFLGCVLRAVEASDAMLEGSKQKARFFEQIRNTAMNESKFQC